MAAALHALRLTIDELRLQLTALQDENAELRRQLAGGAAARRRPISAPPAEPARSTRDADRSVSPTRPLSTPGDLPTDRLEDSQALLEQDLAAADAVGHGHDTRMRETTKRATDPEFPSTPEKDSLKHRRSDPVGAGRHD